MLINDKIIYKIDKYINGFDIIYWINLDRSNDRRNNMLKMLSYLPIRNIRITAIDGKNSTDDMIYNNIITTNYNGSKTEFACLLSHLNTIRLFSESDYNVALILEDDMTLEFAKYWIKDIKSIINEAPSDWDIIMLSYITHQSKSFIENYTYNNINIWGTGAYLINKKGSINLMNKILENNKFNLHGMTPTADDFIYNNIITYTYKYPYFTYSDDNDSIIHNSHLHLHQVSKLNRIAELEELYKQSDEFMNILNVNKYNKYTVIFLSIIFISIIIIGIQTLA